MYCWLLIALRGSLGTVPDEITNGWTRCINDLLLILIVLEYQPENMNPTTMGGNTLSGGGNMFGLVTSYPPQPLHSSHLHLNLYIYLHLHTHACTHSHTHACKLITQMGWWHHSQPARQTQHTCACIWSAFADINNAYSHTLCQQSPLTDGTVLLSI